MRIDDILEESKLNNKDFIKINILSYKNNIVSLSCRIELFEQIQTRYELYGVLFYRNLPNYQIITEQVKDEFIKSFFPFKELSSIAIRFLR